MARCLRAELAKLHEVVEADGRQPGLAAFRVNFFHARQMQRCIKQHRGVADRENEAVAIGPERALGIVPQIPAPKRVHDWRHRHGRARVAAVGLLDGIHGQRPDRVDCETIGRTVPNIEMIRTIDDFRSVHGNSFAVTRDMLPHPGPHRQDRRAISASAILAMPLPKVTYFRVCVARTASAQV